MEVGGFRKHERPRSPGAGPSIGFAWNSTFRHQFRIRARAPVVRPKLRHHQNWNFLFIKLLSSQNGADYNTPPIFDATSFFTFFGFRNWSVVCGSKRTGFSLFTSAMVSRRMSINEGHGKHRQPPLTFPGEGGAFTFAKPGSGILHGNGFLSSACAGAGSRSSDTKGMPTWQSK